MVKFLMTENSVEGKIYGFICIISAIMCFVSGLFNFYIGIEAWFNFVAIGVSPVFLLLYFNFKRGNLIRWQFNGFIVFLSLLLGFSWFMSNGILGGLPLIFLLFMIVLMMISDTKFYKYLVPSIFAYFILLYLSQKFIYEPLNPYKTVFDHEIDILFTTVSVMILILYIIVVYKKAYEKDRIELHKSLLITEKSRAEAEKFSLMQTDFLANMSHEIRTPLNGIIGNSDLLMNIDKGEDPREYIEHIAHSAEILLSLVNNILDLSKIESDKFVLIENSFDLKLLIEQIKSVFKITADQKKIALIFEVDPNIESKLIGDGNRLKQILVNLIGNSIKFTENGAVFLKVNTSPQNDSIEFRNKRYWDWDFA